MQEIGHKLSKNSTLKYFYTVANFYTLYIYYVQQRGIFRKFYLPARRNEQLKIFMTKCRQLQKELIIVTRIHFHIFFYVTERIHTTAKS